MIWVLLLLLLLLFIRRAARHKHMCTCLLCGETAWSKWQRQIDVTDHRIPPPLLYARLASLERVETAEKQHRNEPRSIVQCLLADVLYTEGVTYISLGHRWFSKRTIVKVLTSLRPTNKSHPARSLWLLATEETPKFRSKYLTYIDVYQPPRSLCSVHLCCCLYVRSFVHLIVCTLVHVCLQFDAHCR